MRIAPTRVAWGAIRLNKILWFADCHAFRENGVSITGDTYLKRKFGPVPKHVLAALRDLEGEGKVVVREVPYSTRKNVSRVYLTHESGHARPQRS
ncbi:Panacea domain-containing protein [Novosphingobium colocasiae]